VCTCSGSPVSAITYAAPHLAAAFGSDPLPKALEGCRCAPLRVFYAESVPCVLTKVDDGDRQCPPFLVTSTPINPVNNLNSKNFLFVGRKISNRCETSRPCRQQLNNNAFNVAIASKGFFMMRTPRGPSRCRNLGRPHSTLRLAPL
jgi:hypothetical protein